jgi:hypothetical protein
MNTKFSERLKNRLDQQAKNAPLTIDLGGAKVIKELPARQITLSKIEITSIEDSAVAKTVTARINAAPGTIVLWEGAAYDAIGQWTDTDVVNRIKEIYK